MDDTETLQNLYNEYCGLEVFYSKRKEQTWDTCFWDKEENKPRGSGYYYWFCAPGCLPEDDPIGPFETQREAEEDAVQNFGD